MMLETLKAIERSSLDIGGFEPSPSPNLSSRLRARQKAAESFAGVETLQATASGAEERKHSLHLNVPCVVQGSGAGFESVTRRWLTEDGRINESYFRKHYGELRVPLKPASSSQLDEDGRAEDLPCITVTMLEWLETYRYHPDKHYLKDFHLLASLPSSSASDLYSPPAFARTDVLNPFLAAYDGGDYKFVYWGPLGSATGLHSDVANTFSWSYNVVGEKEWVFYNPSDESRQVRLTQRSGELVFVPAGWKHTVRNVTETISINHNWVHPASIDLVWECVEVEVRAVEEEAKKWGLEMTVPEKERMLRGSCGLSVSMFFFMALRACLESARRISAAEEAEERDDALYDYWCCREMLETLLGLDLVMERVRGCEGGDEYIEMAKGVLN